MAAELQVTAISLPLTGAPEGHNELHQIYFASIELDFLSHCFPQVVNVSRHTHFTTLTFGGFSAAMSPAHLRR